MANSVISTKRDKWVYGRCAQMKRMTSTLAKGFVCKLGDRPVTPRSLGLGLGCPTLTQTGCM